MSPKTSCQLGWIVDATNRPYCYDRTLIKLYRKTWAQTIGFHPYKADIQVKTIALHLGLINYVAF